MASVPLMLLATASQAAFDRSSSGRMATWLRTATRPFSRRQPMNFMFDLPLPLAMSPPLGLEIVDVDVLALGDISDRLADILAVFPYGVALLDVDQRDLVPDRNVHSCPELERRVVGCHHAQHVGSGLEPFNHHHANRVLFIMHQQLRNCHRMKSSPRRCPVVL